MEEFGKIYYQNSLVNNSTGSLRFKYLEINDFDVVSSREMFEFELQVYLD